MSKGEKMIPVKVDQIFLSNVGFVVLLKGTEDERSLPIFIGAAEAQAIAIHMNNVEVPRPLTHDLLKNTLDFLECRLKRIEVCDIRDSTFYATLVLEKDGNEMRMDSRPSDAIALALRCDAPIYVYKKVMTEAGRVFSESELGGDHAVGVDDVPGKKEADEKSDKSQEKLSHLEALKKDLDKAVEDERYEDAARLRDEIKRLKQTHTHN